MLIRGNNARMTTEAKAGSTGDMAVALVVNGGGGGGDISGVTLKTPDKAMVTLEWVQELGGWFCALPQQLVEGVDVVVAVANGVVSITTY